MSYFIKPKSNDENIKSIKSIYNIIETMIAYY